MFPSYTQTKSCILCATNGGEHVWHNERLRVIMVDEPHFVGFTRVVWNDHVKEMTDLTTAQQHELLNVVFVVERVMRDVLKPTKINLASYGNMTPHLHWHVIPRFADDINFPNPIWAISKEQAAQTAQPCVSKTEYENLVKALRIALWAL